jgi:hypothetical protein
MFFVLLCLEGLDFGYERIDISSITQLDASTSIPDWWKVASDSVLKGSA